ncbi:hypothetical protein K4A83_19105 [Spirulina subsalsa FACHB-351]|uniref:Uncharacterized protein n=1 Tax=Spirulina subsalsa FACHB-351 TaxID=234711 RepID=A0ABT3LBL4_9CYAN|nr:hypothetical protein [Spirulina subsalsa]MCW6038365.1 hypothetical protein [Spirulina subsalsa FACHB-351]
MSKKNETTILAIALFVTLGIVGAGFYFLRPFFFSGDSPNLLAPSQSGDSGNFPLIRSINAHSSSVNAVICNVG